MLIEYNVLPVPKDEHYRVRWPGIEELSDVDEARIVASTSAALASAAQSGNIITPQEYRVIKLKLPAEPLPGMGELVDTQAESVPGGEETESEESPPSQASSLSPVDPVKSSTGGDNQASRYSANIIKGEVEAFTNDLMQSVSED